MRIIKFRAWDEGQKYMAYQGAPDIETLQSFMFHFGDKELMQYTGLNDKNGKEIYEGDIFRDDAWTVIRAVIEFEQGTFGWWSDGGEEFIELRECKNIEVVGNIYENPELLK